MRRHASGDRRALSVQINADALHDGGHVAVLAPGSGDGQPAAHQDGGRHGPQGGDAALYGDVAGDLVIIPQDGGVIRPRLTGRRRTASADGRLSSPVSPGIP